MECIEIKTLNCPKCNRVLKPSVEESRREKIGKDAKGSILYIKSPDLLICRYCKLSVKSSLLRKQKNPIEFLNQFAKVPENTEIKEEEIYNIRLREEHYKNLKKYKYEVVPGKCLECDSEDIVADSEDNSWVCLSCDSYFELRNYRIMFHGDIEVFARDHDEAIEKGYERLRKGSVDIEADWM